MLINFDHVLRDFDGEALHDTFAKNKGTAERPVFPDLTLRRVAMNALMNEPKDQADGETKLKRFNLAQRIMSTKGPVEVIAEEVALIKAELARLYTPLVAGQALPLLDAVVQPDTSGDGAIPELVPTATNAHQA